MHFQFESLTNFISMNGHGGYVWACYLFTVAIVALLGSWPWLKRRRLMARRRRQRRIDSR